MLDANLLHSLPKLPTPVLSAYLDTNPAKARNQGHSSGARIWLKSRGKVLLERAPRDQKKELRSQLKRLEEYLETHPPRARGMVFFAGPEIFLRIPLQVTLENELHWGEPSQTQILWILDEHQPMGVVVVDRSGSRFFRYWLGEIEEQKSQQFEMDTSEWRKKTAMPQSRPGNVRARGSQRDVFEQRLDAQFTKLFKETAQHITAWSEQQMLAPVFVAGPVEAAEPVWGELPKAFREKSALVTGLPSHPTPAELLDRIDPEIARWKRCRELQEVESILDHPNGARAVVGMDETLTRVQEGQARSLLVVRGVGGKLRQCAKCGWATRSPDKVCSMCGGERRVAAIRAILPELARKHGVTVEVVAGEAAEKLRAAGCLAAWLR